MKLLFKKYSGEHRGMAMPTALFLVLMIGAVGAIFSRTSIESLKIVKLNEASVDTFQISEGVVNDVLRQMASLPHLWRERTSLAARPAAYVSYSPALFAATNGIPFCEGASCQRKMHPMGGGLIKNFGPLNGDGDLVDPQFSIVDQLDFNSPPDPDVILNGKQAWVQVERLDETGPGNASIGGELANNPGGGNTASSIRFRLTGTTFRKVQGRNGQSTVILVAELPAS